MDDGEGSDLKDRYRYLHSQKNISKRFLFMQGAFVTPTSGILFVDNIECFQRKMEATLFHANQL